MSQKVTLLDPDHTNVKAPYGTARQGFCNLAVVYGIEGVPLETLNANPIGAGNFPASAGSDIRTMTVGFRFEVQRYSSNLPEKHCITPEQNLFGQTS